ncbi:MAG: cobalamin B12-binding domain-containing protein [Nitrospirae bacterium]|nr:cobalamin B12-binding domain-containing protein [Nitrospirota bacterium]MBI4847279.1 cobalamin B12-binding domain-containing protein [Nitrospirota bacterium]
MPKVTFVYPDFENLGTQYLMSVCLKNGYETDLVYYQARNNFVNRVNKSLSFPDIAKRVVNTNPDVVAFSCVTDNYQYQLKCAKALKEIMPHVITIFGGIHPTAVPQRVLNNPEVDCVAIGEAEISFSEFLQEGRKENKFVLPDKPVKGIVFKSGDRMIGEFIEGKLSDLDEVPFPHKAPFSSLMKLTGEYRIITSRGCPYSCSYCFNSFYHVLRGKKDLRRRTVQNVIDELLHAKKQFSPKYISFWDDSFTTSKNWIREFCSEFKSKINLPFMCIVNPFYIDNEIAELLSSTGCIFVGIGVESTSEEVCSKILNRRSNNEKIVQAIKYLKEAGILVQADHLLGVPGDTLEKEEESVMFYNGCRPDIISVYWLTYYPKTEIVSIAYKQGLLSDKDIDSIEQGTLIESGSLLTGGSLKDPKRYYSINFLFNYFPLLPKWLVYFLIKSRLYRLFRIQNYYITTALPRVVIALTKRRYVHGRVYIMNFLNEVLLSKFRSSNS